MRENGEQMTQKEQSQPREGGEVARYWWDMAARWMDEQKLPPDLERCASLAQLLEEVCVDGTTSQHYAK